MNTAIGRAWIASACIFVLLLGTLTYVQFFDSKNLQANAWNSRTLYESYGSQRGSIVVDGVEVAVSVESNDGYAFQRTYPQADIYAGLTGYFSSIYGATGLESAMDEQLSGNSDAQFYDRIAQMFTGNTAAGASVELTIDGELQQLSYNLLQGHKGSIVALNPQTGEILAMVSSPSYDPNVLASHNAELVIAEYAALNEDPARPLYNRAIAGDTYAPASTFKIIDAVAALESGEYTADSVIPNPQNLSLPNTDVTLPNYLGGNCTARSEATIEWAFAQSCNTPFAQIAMKVGQEQIAQTAQNFGYGQDLSIPLTVSQSVFPTNMEDSQLALASIGQYDVKTTPLQVAMTSAAIANEGVQMKPNLIRSVKSHNLSSLYDFSAEQLRRSTSTEVAHQVRDWMVNSVDQGIAAGAGVDGVSVGGKTGTAETGTDTVNSWFTGFAPANDPQVAIAVVYEDVDTTTGSQLSTSAAQQIFEAVLNQ